MDGENKTFIHRVNDVEIKIGALESDVKNMTKAVGSLSQSISDLTAKVSSNNRTDWNVIIAAGVLILSVISVVGATVINPLKSDLDLLIERQFDHLNDDGHQGSLHEIATLKRFKEQYEDTDLINAAQWERIKGLERNVFGKPARVEHGEAVGSK